MVMTAAGSVMMIAVVAAMATRVVIAIAMPAGAGRDDHRRGVGVVTPMMGTAGKKQKAQKAEDRRTDSTHTNSYKKLKSVYLTFNWKATWKIPQIFHGKAFHFQPQD